MITHERFVQLKVVHALSVLKAALTRLQFLFLPSAYHLLCIFCMQPSLII